MKTPARKQAAGAAPARPKPVASTRLGKRNLTTYVDEATFRQFKMIAVEESTRVQGLLVEAINGLFASRGQPQLA